MLYFILRPTASLENSMVWTGSGSAKPAGASASHKAINAGNRSRLLFITMLLRNRDRGEGRFHDSLPAAVVIVNRLLAHGMQSAIAAGDPTSVKRRGANAENTRAGFRLNRMEFRCGRRCRA